MKVGKILVEEARKKQSQRMNPEDIYQIDQDNHTYHILNERPGMYDGSPDAVRLDLVKGREKMTWRSLMRQMTAFRVLAI